MRRSVGLAFHTMCAAAALSAGALQAQAAPKAAPQTLRADSDSADDYGWIDKADSLWEAIGNAPPDRSFAFEGGEPWAWETRDGYRILVEDNGEGIRSFYFEPGSDAPFLAVTPEASFGFADGGLAMVYGPGGDALRAADRAGYDRQARALYERGERMLAAMLGGEVQPVDTGAWIDAAPFIQVFLTAWDAGRTRYPGWRHYRENDGNARALRRRLEAERLRRMGITRRFENWRAGGFEGTPSGRWRKPGDRPDRPHRQGRAGGEWHRPGQGGWERGIDQGAGPGRVGRGAPSGPATATGAPATENAEGGRPRRWGDGTRPERPANGELRRLPPLAPVVTGAASSDAVPAAETPLTGGRRGGNDRPRWNRPAPAPVTTPSAGSEGSDASAPTRPRWNRSEEGGARWNRPAPTPAVTPSGGSETSEASPPARPRWNPSDEGRMRWNRAAPAPTPTVTPSGSSAASDAPPPPRPRWNRSEGSGTQWNRPAPPSSDSSGGGQRPAPRWNRSEGGGMESTPAQPVVTQRSYTPPPAPTYSAPAPSYSAPTPSYSPPAPRPQPSYPRVRKTDPTEATITSD